MMQMPAQGLYDPSNEHDACGVGFVAHIKGHKSHSIVTQGLSILSNLNHRGAVGADPLMGDGAGIMIQLPDAFYRQEMINQGVALPPFGEYGVGMIFLPQEQAARLACEQEIERRVSAEGQVVLGWRDVPVNRQLDMSDQVKANEPVIRQIFIGRGPDVMIPDMLERKLYVIRKTASHAIRSLNLTHGSQYFVASMSARTVVYKGLLLSSQVGEYFLDLQDSRVTSALALVHQRFSTNTFPSWELAHPYRFVAHNGEINTVKGNVNWLNARTRAIESPVLGADLEKLWPLVYPEQSDTASFDNCLELLVMGGYPLAQAVMMMIPEAWEQHAQMDPSQRAFYEYHAAIMEPWDGPAALAFTDGRQIGATLDRNGLRPARYIITDDDLVILASEAGTLPVAEEKIIKKWRLQPGKMLLIDMEVGRIISDQELKDQVANARPYQQWIERIRVKLDDVMAGELPALPEEDELRQRQSAFGYSIEDLKFQLLPMAENGQEALGSMGNDTPLAVLSSQNKSIYDYFRQKFAQVTNPAIDPIREKMVMSLTTFIGPKPNLLDVNNTNPPLRLEVNQPILNAVDMSRIRGIGQYTRGKFVSHELDITYPVAWGQRGLEARLASLCAQAADAIEQGSNILIVSDRHTNCERMAIPALLATSAIHQHLVRKGLRTSTGLVVETGSAREVHHFALLGGYGAEAVHPYLALQTLASYYANDSHGVSPEQAKANYMKAIDKGLQKVMSKMGLSTYMSYTGGQLFEAVGLSRELVDHYFFGTQSNIEGIGLFDVAEEAVRWHRQAYQDDSDVTRLAEGGDYAWRVHGEEHMWTPDAVAKLQHATRANDANSYAEYAQIINDQSRRHMTLRGLFDFRFDQATPIPLDQVEPAKEIVKRFATGAMSLGSISTEAHTTLAIAMNRIGGKSNTGEGGEDPARYQNELRGISISEGDKLAALLGKDADIVRDLSLKQGDSLRSRIKQVASGRFGVTAAYLASADQIQIKVSQGAKPGEGGQLPGHKVSQYIAGLRFSVPGVGLISPPPHHDIYSIEDLAQLIYDLKSCNPSASISVKLVAEVGVGTVAAGVAKCKADHVVIAGHDGGTGASPWSSIKRAGSPWELGLAETQQTLVLNRLRGRIRVQADGQMKTGRDVVMGALLGADEFGFATAPLVVEGCIMMHKCHLNTCPTGIATQDPELRKRFTGQPDHVVNYFFMVAEEARQIMAQLGVSQFDDLVGRVEMLDVRAGIDHWKACGLDFSRVFYRPEVPSSVAIRHCEEQDHALEEALDRDLIKRSKAALENGGRVVFQTPVKNLNRTVGTQLSGELVRRYGHAGLTDDSIHIRLDGSVGQSFGAFLTHGITLELVGEGNDYVGKSLCGGHIIVRQPDVFHGYSPDQIIVGNTVLYGATSGEAYFNGVAGERFAVRNSGALTVVEGVGDHACEYMTGGTVVVLGQTGRNFAAGMSGGVAYVYDPDGRFAACCNTDMVALESVLSVTEQERQVPRFQWHSESRRGEPMTDDVLLRRLVESHFEHTGSARASELLTDWEFARSRFVKVLPHEYKRALISVRQELAATTDAGVADVEVNA